MSAPTAEEIRAAIERHVELWTESGSCRASSQWRTPWARPLTGAGRHERCVGRLTQQRPEVGYRHCRDIKVVGV